MYFQRDYAYKLEITGKETHNVGVGINPIFINVF